MQTDHDVFDENVKRFRARMGEYASDGVPQRLALLTELVVSLAEPPRE